MLKSIARAPAAGPPDDRFPDEEPTPARSLPRPARPRPRAVPRRLPSLRRGLSRPARSPPATARWRSTWAAACSAPSARSLPRGRDRVHRATTGSRRAARRSGGELAGAEPHPDARSRSTTRSRRLFGRSLKLRVVSAGGCNGCEADVNVLGTIVFDLGRFGIQFVASPRHADGLVITGPVTENMRLALQKTYDAVPDPKIVIAVGACAISGGPYVDHPEVHDGADSAVPGRPLHPGLPAAPAHDPRRPARSSRTRPEPRRALAADRRNREGDPEGERRGRNRARRPGRPLPRR